MLKCTFYIHVCFMSLEPFLTKVRRKMSNGVTTKKMLNMKYMVDVSDLNILYSENITISSK